MPVQVIDGQTIRVSIPADSRFTNVTRYVDTLVLPTEDGTTYSLLITRHDGELKLEIHNSLVYYLRLPKCQTCHGNIYTGSVMEDDGIVRVSLHCPGIDCNDGVLEIIRCN